MLKSYYQVLPVLILSVIILYSCNKHKDDDNCVSYSQARVIAAVGPSTGSVSQPLNFIITYGIDNGCGQFDHFEESATANTTSIKLINKYTGCLCTEIYREFGITYPFKAASAGIYYLEFLNNNNTTVRDTIVIQ